MAEPQARPEPSRAQKLPTEQARRCRTCGASYPIDFLVCPKDATALELQSGDTDPFVGEVLAGSFCVTALLGSGGMGRVYEAEHVRLPRRFAVKVLHDHFAAHAEAMARFEREAQAVARVDSEHVVEVVDVVRAKDGRPCIVTELLEGEELGALLERTKKLALPTAITICRQICRGLDAAHAAGVVHRDLKPSNLFLVRREAGVLHVKILDFGVAKLTDGADLTRTGMIVGTPAFMAPEQARGSSLVDVRADVYAVGAILYRMLTGASPFPDDDPTVTLTRLLTEDPRRPRAIDKTIPVGVEALIQRAMARAPADRPGSVQELDKLLATFDAPAPNVRVTPAATAPFDLAVGSMSTVAVGMLSPEDAVEVTRRARRARPAALGLAVVTSLAGGAAVLTSVAVGLRAVGGHNVLDSADHQVVAVAAGGAAVLALLAASRVLVARWRSVPSIQRLGEGLRAALRWLFGSLGALALGWYGYSSLGPPPPAHLRGPLELGVVLVPTLLAAVVLAVSLRRAGRVA